MNMQIIKLYPNSSLAALSLILQARKDVRERQLTMRMHNVTYCYIAI